MRELTIGRGRVAIGSPRKLRKNESQIPGRYETSSFIRLARNCSCYLLVEQTDTLSRLRRERRRHILKTIYTALRQPLDGLYPRRAYPSTLHSAMQDPPCLR